VKIEASSTLREVAFVVCTELDRSGVTAVLTGGSAAAVYAPGVCQSPGLDFVAQALAAGARGAQALESLGYRFEKTTYRHPENPLTLNFPASQLAVGGNLVRTWATLHESSFLLHILSPTDCCRDRLTGFLFWQDRGSLIQAAAVAGAQHDRVDLESVRRWCAREGHADAFREFIRVLDPRLCRDLRDG
jgi:hypothetical protein